MKVKVEKAGPCRKLLNIEVPADVVAAEFAKVIEAWAQAARIPGFRKGKAPLALVEGHYAKDIQEEVKERLIAGTYREALKQEQLDPVNILNLDVTLDKGKPMTYKVTLDVPPEFKLPRYKAISLKGNPVEVTDEQVQIRLDLLLDQLAKYDPVEGRAVHKGDLAQIDYEGTCEGKRVGDWDKQAAGLGQGRDFWVMADENSFLPGFDTGLLGLAVGDRKEITVTFPADFKVKTMAGRTALYQVTLKAIREKKRPAVDAALLKEFQVDSETALRAKLREALLGEARLREKERLKDEICRFLLAKTSLELPESLVQEETRNMFASMIREHLMRGMTREEVEGQRDQLLSLATKSAGDKVKLGYILHRIAEEDKIAVADTEVDAAVQQMALRYRVTPEELRKTLEEKKELESIRYEVRMNKTLEMILENAKVGEEGFFKRLIGG
ncbi:MAG: trigger factor [Verrucomicrobia bacterium]|nr:trigger factor [Verrucomicrobiota bacterium]MCG2678429.1 trigger factor [Kiritimatiellia bacterium]MBU4247814.1 trigger factor [Verrucomicrobiota bacterium]MBU4291944.1 trigger factor [Verrucomicrobiota bacterium]MBU4430066.1 trigger factor [Verrucomicrobiota bacterium]